MASSVPSGARQDGGMLPDGFPVGMRVLAVDDDCICLTTLKQMLQRCGYQVTAKTTAEEALKELRENPEGFDLVMTDVHMPGMDGFGLLNHAKDLLPVIMFSADEDTETVTRGVVGGACDYLLKPLRMEELRNIWQHVARRRLKLNVAPGVNAARRQGASSSNAAAAGGNHDGEKAKTAKKWGADESDRDEGSSNNQPAKSRGKKPKFYWGPEAHALFVKAVNQLQATEGPKRIKELLELEGVNVTAEQVASHLQKYRKHCDTKTKEQSNLNAGFSTKASSSYTNSLKNYYNCQDATSSRMPNSFIPGGQAHAILPHQPAHSVGTSNNHRTITTHKNYVKSQEMEINIRNYMRSQETTIGYVSLARQTSLLRDATSVGVLGNGSQANKGSTACHGGVPTNEGLQVSSVKASNGTQPQQKQCFSTGFPTNFNAIRDSNPKTQVGFASQTSPLGYDNGVLSPWSPWSGLDGLDDDVLMSSLLVGDEVMQNATTLDGSQAMRDLRTTGDLSASKPQGLNSDFFNWGNTDGTTSTFGGVLTDGMLNDQLHNELGKKINKLNCSLVWKASSTSQL